MNMENTSEHDQLIAERINAAERKMMMAVYAAESEDEITAMYAALASSLSQSVRLRCEEIEAPIDKIRASVDRFFLMQGGSIE